MKYALEVDGMLEGCFPLAEVLDKVKNYLFFGCTVRVFPEHEESLVNCVGLTGFQSDNFEVEAKH